MCFLTFYEASHSLKETCQFSYVFIVNSFAFQSGYFADRVTKSSCLEASIETK